MTVLKLDERERAGRFLGDWLRAELRAVGDACKCTNWFSLSDGEAYVALKDDLDEGPGTTSRLYCAASFQFSTGENGLPRLPT